MVVLILYLLVITAGRTWAATNSSQANQYCLKCHSAQGLQVVKDNRPISLYINPALYRGSIHGSNACSTCHANIKKYPHDPLTRPGELATQVEARCRSCHADIVPAVNKSIHNVYGVKCADCHGQHQIYKKEDFRSTVYSHNITLTCTNCHNGEVKESYAESFHGKAVSLGSLKAATCVSCHSGHAIYAASSPNLTSTCARCHLFERLNYGQGAEHAPLKPHGPGKPVYWTLKFFTWLTIVVIVVLILHIELELFHKLRQTGREDHKLAAASYVAAPEKEAEANE